MLIVFAGEAAVDVSKPCPDAVLVPFEGFQVDGVGEVRGEQLVALVRQALTVLGQFGQFLGAGGEPFIERCLDLGGEGGVLLFGDGDVSVAVRDQLLGDSDGHGPSGAVLSFGGSTGADVVGVAHALLVGWVVQLHP
ncbi:hypothetical protein [Brevibacterium ravenspurgense]|uniref:hypothetical protein n=1 Tax=Brevibacterium ravenspurgense TaxID=479117 RepID=UPI000784E38D|nr:hypothetical protein [Brevibacterium ravenspurgense]